MSSPDTLAAVGPPTPSPAPQVRPPVASMESVLAHRWARLLIPSLSDLFFLAIGVWLFVSGGGSGWQGLLADADAGWHIRTGEYILDHHAVPHQDLYSFSKPGAPWYAWEWLTDVIDGGLHRIGGLKGVVLAAAVIIALFATTLVRRMVWRGTHLMIALIVALLGVGAAAIHFLARPHIYTLLFLSISMWLIEADRERMSAASGAGSGPDGLRRIWWLVPLTIVWTNMHGGFLAVIAVLGLTTLGLAIENLLAGNWNVRERRASWNSALRYAGITAACAASTLINPYGWRLHQHLIEYLRSDWVRNVIQEFQSPSFRGEYMLQFEALMLLGLMAALALLQRRRVVEALWIVFWAHMALASARHVPVFITVAAPAVAFELSRWWGRWTAASGKASIAGIVNQIAADALAGFRRTSVWPAVAVLALVVIGAPPASSPHASSGDRAAAGIAIRWPQDFPDLLFPTKMVHSHADLIFSSRVFTTDQWGDYLIYTDPTRKVFVDGRSDFYGPEVGNQYLGILNGRWDWQQLLNKYGFNLALLPVESSIAQLLKLSPEWSAVEDDGKAILLVRRGPAVPLAGNLPRGPRF